ncbi:unnamed protein product [Bursaphelenchus okinawaensis]|uniref:Apple domain-containing protein n=1 Tax=Bursaphelenchus okinawaensis TaxID=465554 RepID=A0A811KH77_9BILA|nr:unnamed protein product [Bursaphelenchus okinawaensis]CAG9102287.1 unnamed protein product [Bursaphelenchus okinawaensis]
MSKLFTLTLLLIVYHVECTTEWFGDLRAHMNPSNNPAFYDITYDDDDCPQGLESNAIPEYVYFGAMISTKMVEGHSDCLQHCVLNDKCKAINYFEPMGKNKNGYCELLSETQWDNPRLMRPFHKAVYYEKIRCRDDEQLDSFDLEHKFQPATVESKPTTTTTTLAPKTKPGAPANFDAKKKPVVEDNLKLFKKLSDKIHEFNMRFRARL